MNTQHANARASVSKLSMPSWEPLIARWNLSCRCGFISTAWSFETCQQQFEDHPCKLTALLVWEAIGGHVIAKAREQ